MELDTDLANELDKLYFSSEHRTINFNDFWDLIKKEGLKVPYKLAKEFYRQQEVRQVFAQFQLTAAKKPEKEERHIKSDFPGQKVSLDTVYFGSYGFFCPRCDH